MAIEVLLDDQRSDGRGQVSAKPSILDVYADGNAGMVHGRESHEDGMVLTMVFCRSRLPTDLISRGVNTGTGAFRDSCPHAFDDDRVGIR